MGVKISMLVFCLYFEGKYSSERSVTTYKYTRCYYSEVQQRHCLTLDTGLHVIYTSFQYPINGASKIFRWRDINMRGNKNNLGMTHVYLRFIQSLM
jgi:hypothetical protein